MPPERSDKPAIGPELVALFCVLVMVLWFTDEIVRAGKIPFYRDLGPYFYPMRFNLAMSVQAGELPLWNRHVAMGFPLAANIQSGAFYPPHLVFLVLPFFDALRFLYVFHFLVAAIGSYALCRRWSYPPYLALIGSILFTFGGLIVSLTNLLDHFQTAVWFPWVLLLAERSLRTRSWNDFLLYTLVAVVQFLAGSPELYAMSQVFILLDGLWLKAAEVKLSYRKLFSVILGANALVAALAMVQILPTLELFLNSWRSETLPYAKGTAWSLPALGLVNLIFLDKEPNAFAFNGVHLYFTRERPLLISLYLGALVLPGICLWFFTSSLREKACLLGIGFIALLLALGGHTPVYPFLFQYLPLFTLIRFPEKFLFLVSVIFLFMALRGLFRSLCPNPAVTWTAWLTAALVSLLIFLLPYLLLRLNLDSLIQFIAKARQSSPFDVSTLQISSGVLVHLERQIFLTMGLVVLLLLFKSGRLRVSLFEILLVALVFFDLSSAHRSYLFPLSPEVISRRPAVIEAAAEEPARLFYNHDLSYLHPSSYQFSHRPFAETVASVFAALMPNTGVFRGFDYMQELDALGRKPYDWFLKVANKLPPKDLYRLLGTLNVKHIVSLQPLPPGDLTLVRHYPEYPVWLYRIDRWVPRAYIVPKIVVIQDPRESLTRLASAGFDPLGEVVVEEMLELTGPQKFQSQAELLNYTNRQAIIHASLNHPGVLVLADSFYPGWRVYVDGREEKILRANFFFRGVLLPSGEHTVEFKYQPRWFTIGLYVSLATGGVLFLVALFCMFQRRRLR